MTEPTLLLLHGWAFDMHLWDGLLPFLTSFPVIRWDRGYFDAPQEQQPKGRLVAVGHSFGAMLLADRLATDVKLVAINGFDRFTGQDGVPGRVIQQMQRGFNKDPGAVVDAFRARCGARPAAAPLNEATLRADLALLASHRAGASDRQVLVLHGSADPIVPDALRTTGFPGAPRKVMQGGGHLLPMTHPQWCAKQITAFACA